MPDREMVMAALECLADGRFCACCRYKPYDDCEKRVARDAIILLKEQEPIKPIINEYGEAYCVCGENVGIIPNSKNLPKIRSKYCSECGRRMKWE